VLFPHFGKLILMEPLLC